LRVLRLRRGVRGRYLYPYCKCYLPISPVGTWSAPSRGSGDGALAHQTRSTNAKAVSLLVCHRTPYVTRPSLPSFHPVQLSPTISDQIRPSPSPSIVLVLVVVLILDPI